jgi:sugar lactone lactonase YvrE
VRTIEVPSERDVVGSSFSFPEGLRWRDGHLWFSDMHTGDVYRLEPDAGELVKQLVVEDQPSGMGWLPDGSMLLSLMLSRRILRIWPDGSTSIHADLSALTEYPVNELVVDELGRGYLGTFGYDIYAGDPLQQASVYRVDPDGSVTEAADAFDFPNGSVILPGTNTLVIAHSFRPELTGFEIAADGTLVNRRVWAVLPEGTTADGLAVDSQGRIWVSSILTHEFLQVQEGGNVLTRVTTPGRLAVDCVVDGRSDEVLYISTSTSIQPAETKGRLGTIQRVRLA